MRRLKYGIGFLGFFLLFASYRIVVGPFYAYCCTKKDHARLTQILTPIANLSYSDNFIGNHLHSAVYGSPEQVEFLLQKGVDPNGRDRDGETPLIHVAKFEKFDEETQKKMDLLLDHGADIWACDKEGNSVFFHATGNLDCLKYLISRCENFDPFVVNYEGKNLLFGAIENERNDDPAVLQFLLSQGLDPNSPSFEWHYLPLEEACTFSRPRLVRTLLEAGAQYGSLTEFNTRHHLTPEIFEILKSYEDRQVPDTGNTSPTREALREAARIRTEEYKRHQPPSQLAYDIKMRRYYDYKFVKEACIDPPPELPEDVELERIYKAETESHTMTFTKWVFQILFGG